MENIALTAEKVSSTMAHIIAANNTNLALGRQRISFCIEGEPGLGKTALVNQYAKANDLAFVQLNLAQIEEISDLVGFPIKEFKLVAKAKTAEGGTKMLEKWVTEKAIDPLVAKGWTISNDTRMSYAKPEWLTGHGNSPGILFLDDYSRANPAFMQATMQLIQNGEYISWKLPDNWTVILSTNPDDGENSVSTMDTAQSTRFMKATIKYSEKDWAKWAEAAGIDGRAINFMLMYPEAVTAIDDNGASKTLVNPRQWVQFFNSLVNMDDYNEANNLAMIRLLGEMSVGAMGANLFVTFINNKLDKLISPEEILLGDTDKTVAKLKEIIGHGDSYQSAIGSTLATRYINYTLNYANSNPIPADRINHMEELFKAEVFGADVNYNIIYNLFSKNKQKFAKLLVKPTILEAML